MLESFSIAPHAGKATAVAGMNPSSMHLNADFSISDQLFAFKKMNLTMKEITDRLGVSRNRAIFLCLKEGVDLSGRNSTVGESGARLSRNFRAGEVSVLRDLIERQGCSLATAARIMGIMAHDVISADQILTACIQHKIEAETVRSATARPVQINLAASVQQAEPKTLKIDPVESLPFAPSVPVAPAEYRPLRLRLNEVGEDQCHNIVGRDDEGVTVYCGLPRFRLRQYCERCHGKLLVEPPPIKGITPKRVTAPVELPAKSAITPPKPVNKYREVARAMQARLAGNR